jgi:hypothetical protein
MAWMSCILDGVLELEKANRSGVGDEVVHAGDENWNACCGADGHLESLVLAAQSCVWDFVAHV